MPDLPSWSPYGGGIVLGTDNTVGGPGGSPISPAIAIPVPMATGVGAVDRPLIQSYIDAAQGRRGGRVIALDPRVDYATDGTPIVIKPGVVLGDAREFYVGPATIGPRIIGTGGADVIALPVDGGATQHLGGGVQGLTIVGGRDAITGPNGVVGGAFRRLKLTAQSRYAISLPGFVQECTFDNVECESGVTGLFAPNVAGSGGSIALWDKNTVKELYAHGCSGNGIDIEKANVGSCLWLATRLINCAGNGMRLAGALTGHTFLGLACEGNGLVGVKVARAAGAMFNSAVLTLNGANPGFVVGDLLTVKGAGNSGGDLTSAIVSIANGTFTGSVITLAAAGNNGAVNTEVTKSTVSDILIATTGAGTPSRITFVDALIGGDLPSQDMQYAANLASAGVVAFVGGTTFGRPVYDPNRTAINIGGDIKMRRPFSIEGPAQNISFGSGPPTGLSQHTQGEVIFNDSAAASGMVGWVCVATGVPGTWKTFGAISP